MKIEKRTDCTFIEAGNIVELIDAVVDLAQKGYTPSKKNNYRASGSFGYFTIGLDEPEGGYVEEEVVEEASLFEDVVTFTVQDDPSDTEVDQTGEDDDGSNTDTESGTKEKSEPVKQTRRRKKPYTV